MSVYAQTPGYVDQGRHPRALFFILAGHVALIAAVMTAKMELPPRFIPTITKIDLIPEPKAPPKNPPPPQHRQVETPIDHTTTVVQIPLPQPPQVTPVPMPDPTPGPVFQPQPTQTFPPPQPVRTGPRFITPPSDVKPPYPQSKLRSGEEAVLQLRLTIDENGRVTAVDPLGQVDPVFLSAARRHLIAHWRYTPAKEDGRAVPSSTVVTLRFKLDS
jgi:protein TonB